MKRRGTVMLMEDYSESEEEEKEGVDLAKAIANLKVNCSGVVFCIYY